MTEHLITAVALAILVFVIGRILLARMARIASADARAAVANGAALVDVRTPREFAAGSLPDAKNIPLADLERRLGELDRERDVIVFCASGMRSARAAGILKRAGFKAHDLGPASAW